MYNTKKPDQTCIGWTHKADIAFEQRKLSLQNVVTLSFPRTDSPMELMTDSSNFSLVVVLQQNVASGWQPLGYFSQKMNIAQMMYSPYDKELLANYWAIRNFKDLVEGRQLIIYADHKLLVYTFKKPGAKKKSPKRIR